MSENEVELMTGGVGIDGFTCFRPLCLAFPVYRVIDLAGFAEDLQTHQDSKLYLT